MTIFIDNDELMHRFWTMQAKKKEIEIKCFFSVDEFLENAQRIEKDTEIYIDCELADGVRGEVESKKLYELGFTNLYLATGHPVRNIDKPAWVKKVCGKRPPF